MISRVVFISGGSGSIGREVVRELAASGYVVHFQYESQMEAAEILAHETGAMPHRIDFKEPVWNAPKLAVDILVNCVGINISSEKFLEVSEEDWQLTMKINLEAPKFLIQNYLPGMIERRWGRIVNVGSIYSVKGSSNNSPYNSSKHALSGLTKSLAKEYAEYGVATSEVLPGATESDLMNRIAIAKSSEIGLSAEGYLEMVRDSSPNHLMALPGDIARTVQFLIDDESLHLNGSTITVDGGLTC